jgi:hypothetical protein
MLHPHRFAAVVGGELIAAERDTIRRSGAGTLLSALAWSRIHG